MTLIEARTKAVTTIAAIRKGALTNALDILEVCDDVAIAIADYMDDCFSPSDPLLREVQDLRNELYHAATGKTL